MQNIWTREFLTRRINRCYFLAAWAKAAETRKVHLELARYYRQMLAANAAILQPMGTGLRRLAAST